MMRWANVSGNLPSHGPDDILQEPFDRNNSDTSGVVSSVYSAYGEISPLAELSSSLDVSGNLNFRRQGQRYLYNRILHGSGTLGSATLPSPSWTNRFAGLNGGFIATSLSSSQHEVEVLNAHDTGSLPLETTAVPASASSYYSKQNRFTHVIYKMSASADLTASYSNVNVNYSPTSADTDLIGGEYGSIWINRGPSTIEQSDRGLYQILSGCYVQSTLDEPVKFTLDVPIRGKIKDIKVWVEFIHDLRGGRGPISGSEYSRFITDGPGESSPDFFINNPAYINIRRAAFKRGLGGIVLALRSPNTNFEFAHPLWNGYFNSKNWYGTGENIFSSVHQYVSDRKPEIFKNSYLLWSGHTAELDLSGSIGANAGDGGDGTGSVDPNYNPYYAEFDSDIDMRTIFTDSSRWVNPRNLSPLRRGDTPNGILSMSGSVDMTGSILSHPYQEPYPSPSFFAINMFTLTGSDGNLLKPHPSGNNFPWFYDDRIPPGYLTLVSESLPTSAGLTTINNVPPWYKKSTGSSIAGEGRMPAYGVLPGWLTGNPTYSDWKYGSASDGEFETQGIQIGPPDIQPVYPLLDDIYVKKLSNEPITGSLIPGKDYVGFRPGLRGTEAYGTWELMISTACVVSASNPDDEIYYIQGSGIWFRQWRLELLLETNEELSLSSQINRRHKVPGHAVKPGIRNLLVLSGSSGGGTGSNATRYLLNDDSDKTSRAIDFGINQVYTLVPEHYGRTIGITSNTSSYLADFAVFTQITGSLTGSGIGSFYLNNEFGTPYIPNSSGSSVTPSLYAFDPGESALSRKFISDILNQKTLIKSSNTLQSVLSRNNYLVSTLDLRKTTLQKLNIAEEDLIFSSSYKLKL